MDQLFKITSSVAGYLSPAKRRRTVGPATPSNNAAEEHAFIPNSDPQDKQSYLSFFARLSQKYLSPSDTKQYNGRKRRRDDDDDDDDDDDGNSHGLGGLNLAEDEQTAEEKVLDYIDRQEVFAQRRGAVEDARDGPDFEDEEVDLFDRLAMRSFEPLIPAQWHRDFPTLPPVLFAQDRDEEFISSSNPSSIRAIKALQSLLGLGIRVREQVDLGKHVDQMILREIQNYVKWSEVDGGYSRLRFIPMLAMVATRRGQDIEASAAVLKDQMAFLAQSQREQLTINDGAHVNDDGNVEMYTRPPPIIYGIIIAQGRLIFVTLYSSNPEAEVKHIGSFNLLERNQEVWNGFAVAILVITVRNYMMTIVDELEEDNDVEDSDPDA